MRRTYLIAFLDVLFCMLMVIIVMVHPEQDETLQPPGNLFVYTTWIDNGKGDDVDTWMLAPGMVKPIGYDHKDSVVCNLVKDDLGIDHDKSPYNYENVFCRDTPDGEYIVNLQAYGVKTYPMVVSVQVAMIINGKSSLLFEEEVILTHPKDEQTVIRFTIKDGKVVPGSAHHTFTSLYKVQ